MEQDIKLQVKDIDEETLLFELQCSNFNCLTKISFYNYSNFIEGFAIDLINFPINIEQKLMFEIGKEDLSWFYYIKLEVFCYKRNGDSCLKITINNNQEQTENYKSEFYILTKISNLNELGKKLLQWDPIKEKFFSFNSF